MAVKLRPVPKRLRKGDVFRCTSSGTFEWTWDSPAQVPCERCRLVRRAPVPTRGTKR